MAAQSWVYREYGEGDWAHSLDVLIVIVKEMLPIQTDCGMLVMKSWIQLHWDGLRPIL